MARAHAFPVTFGTLRDHEVRPMRTNDACDFTTEQQRGLDLTVGPAKECDIRHSQLTTSSTLFGLANFLAFFTSVRGTIATGVARSDEAIRNIDALTGQSCNRSGGTKIDIIRVSDYNEGAFYGLAVLEDGQRLLLFAHSTESSLVGSQLARSFKCGSFEKTSTIGRLSPKRRMITSASIIWFHSNKETTTPVEPARAVRPERCR